MVEICNICGLPKDLCVCDQISSQQRLVYVLEKRVKRAKFITEITGIDSQKEMEDLFKDLKRDFACGGTVKKGTIELQGKHKKRVSDFLVKKGYNVDKSA